MKFFKKLLPLLLILAMLLPTVATVNACPACSGWTGEYWPLPMTVTLHEPQYTDYDDVWEHEYYTFPKANEEFIGYDFIGWYTTSVKKRSSYDRYKLYEAGESLLMTATTTCDFYALFGKISANGYSYYTTYADSTLPFPVGHTLSLENGMSVNFLIKKEDLAKYDDVIISATMPDFSGNKTNIAVSHTVSDCGEYQRYTIKDVDATKMNDKITFKLKLVKDGKVAYTEDVYSIADYACSQLKKTKTSDSLKELCANLLQYGGWAQRYKTYRTNAYVDTRLTDEQKAYLTDLDSVVFETINEDMNDLQTPSVQWIGKTLDLQANVTLNTYIDCTNYTGSPTDLQLKIRYTDFRGIEQIAYGNVCTPYNEESRLFFISFDGLPATDLRIPLEFCIVDPSGVQVSTTMRYSIASYGNGKTGTLLSLCQALMAYSDAAVAYKGN